MITASVIKNNKGPQKASGQSMSELLVSLAVIAPLFIFIPVVANYLDVQTATHEAARYMAWERTAYQSLPSNLDEVVKQRFLLKESSGFSSASIKPENDVRWIDYGRTASPRQQVIDAGGSVAVEQRSLTLNINDPVATSNIPAMSQMDADAYGVSSVSFPLSKEGSLFGVFVAGDYYLKSDKNDIPVPQDPVSGTNRFHTKSSSALLADGGVMPINEIDYVQKLTGENGLVTTDGSPLSTWESPARIIDVVFSLLGMGGNETDILYDNGGNLAVVEGQSEILPEGLIEYQ